mgnify:CR=1 FL=1
MNKTETIKIMNEYGKSSKPFKFLISFDMQNNIISDLNDDIFQIKINHNQQKSINSRKIKFEKYPINYCDYQNAFNFVVKNLKYGNSYLLNLTFPTKIQMNYSLNDIFINSIAKYKVMLENKFVCFSPETFIKINQNKIYSYPMKGTIDADIPNALQIITDDKKETAEHYTIVDLKRNDLSIVSKNVRVERFRYADLIQTNTKKLYQISSEICGDLPENYNENLGDLIFALLPAGSITGAPKKKTVEIILEAEKYERGFYTGIAGVYDGKNLDSCVLIRFIEKSDNDYYFKSGGGITIYSDCESEYNELIDKVYVAF